LPSTPWIRAAAAAPVSASTTQVGDEEILKEFKKYFRKYKETVERIEAVRALEEVEAPKVVDILVPLLKDREEPVRDTAMDVLSTFKTQPPIDALLLELTEQTDSQVRVGILHALEKGRYPHDGSSVLPCLEDKDWNVRLRALRALGVLGKLEVVPAILPLTQDSESGVRVAALDTLALLKAKETVPAAQAALVDDVWQVRSSAIQALGLVRDVTSVPLLIDRMEIEEGRLIDDLALALDRLTARGAIRDPEIWRSFWTTYSDRYQLPSDEEIAKILAKREANRALYNPAKGSTAYHGIETPSRSILFIIDVSGSMEDEVTEKDRFKDGNYPSYSRMDITKTELARTIATLEPYVKFNILSFATKVRPWKKDLVPANVLNKSSAKSWIDALEPIGGNSKEELAEVGFGATAALDEGKTNTWEVLATALSIPVDPSKSKTKTDEHEVDVDTIFFLSDGRPTTGYYVKTDAILQKLLEANELRKVVIHTIAIGEFQKTFMKRLAEETGGVFVDLGR
ncbi:MAG TPA: HEAT repeat domain-containing protein, partial [Planctomycetota bacterium]|nr:HEAT repeat domain-containing protein [Planctomycetota bacterium]